jgi:putative ABC transport system permease protein
VTKLLTRLLGRLPIGWLQLIHNRMRLVAALAGVAFANILVFMQLGFLGALTESVKLPYQVMDADILIYSPETNTLADAGTIPRRRMFEALAVEGVQSATPVYAGTIVWKHKDGGSSNLRVLGADPDVLPFKNQDIRHMKDRLRLEDVALLDRKTRSLPKPVIAALDRGENHRFENDGRTITIEGLFSVGAGFDADGYLIVSDQTFLRLFPKRSAGAPNYIFVKLEQTVHAETMAARLHGVLPEQDTVVRTLADAAAKEQSYQFTQKPVGVIFGFGVIIGVLVGIIIVYQVLSTDVADHIAEYATFKAIGYRQSFFLGIVFEEAMILALFGFVPGVFASLALYAAAAAATGLPVIMTASRPVLVLAGTILMCTISGAIATRRLAAADPADLF